MIDPLDTPPVDHGSDRHGYVEVQGPMGSDIWPEPPRHLYVNACPDCLANVFLRWDGAHWHRTVAHDDGCPTLATIEGGED